jgi:CBS domain-containing protein
MMVMVSQCLQRKGRSVWSIDPDASVYDALKLMAEKDIGALLVLEGDELAGIFSERDYARKVVLKGKSSKETTLREIMTSRVICVHQHQSIEECMALMTEYHVRHLPVLVDEKLVGVISIGDVVKEIISEQKFVIEQLEQYITGER